MPDAYLPAGFINVDQAADPVAFSTCLTLIDSLPYFVHIKEHSYQLLQLNPGERVLDAGCGLGDDVFRMAQRVGETGSVTGLDASAKFITQAQADPRAHGLPVDFRLGQLHQLPFPDATFTRARIDRVLQHVVDSAGAIRELARVLQPGGLLLAYDNDWATFTITSSDKRITRLIETTWCDSFANGCVGRDLKGQFLQAGLRDITIVPGVFLVEDYALAEKLFNLRQTADHAIAQGLLAEDEASAWLADLERQSQAGTFTISLTAYTVVGRK